MPASALMPLPDYVHASVPGGTLSARIGSFAHAQHVLKGTFQIWNFYAYAEHTCKILMHMLRVHISS
jgi:hypothetical protein